ncbi:CR1-beta [Simian adenovirus 16]|uniref:CR1-beta n=1 Tax=Simian adenovirus 16 TaxID=1715778 RepID=A0A0M4MQL7_9ADEN|nr:CR1-beta [Simian adenovirus 16]ALE30407.1 CR1-beta [Simian adenovirus 16]
MEALVVLCLIALSAAQTLEKPYNVYVKVGANVTLESHQFHNPSLMQEVSWYVETWSSKPSSSYFSGQKLCQFKKNGANISWDHDPLQFNCVNKSLHMFNLQPSNSGIYNVKITNDDLEYNTYFNLEVVYIPKPQCTVTSYYVARDYCIIEINCTNSKYPNKVLFNGVLSTYYNKARGGKHHLPETFATLIDYHGVQQNFSYTYPFNSLCGGKGKAYLHGHPQHARLEGVQLITPPAYEENPDADSDEAYEKGMAALVIIAVISVIIIIAALLFLCYWRRRLRQRRSRQLMTNQL